jgi:mannose-6-phosphate isomerase-like protein (cupin superfamily)
MAQNIHIKVIRSRESVSYDGPGTGVTSKVLVDNDSAAAKNLSMGWIQFNPGAKTEDHVREVEEVIYVVKGKTVIVAGQFEYYLGAGDCVFIPPGVKHRHENRNNEVLEQIYVFAPPGPERAVRNLPKLLA